MNEVDAQPAQPPTQTATNAVVKKQKAKKAATPKSKNGIGMKATASGPAPIIVTSTGATMEQPASSTTNMEAIPAPAPAAIPPMTNAVAVEPVPPMPTPTAIPEPSPAVTPEVTNAVLVEVPSPMTNVEANPEANPGPAPAAAPEVTNAVAVEPVPPMTNAEPISEPAPATIPAMTNAIATEPASPMTNAEVTPEPAPAMTNILILAATNPAIVTGSSVLRIQPDAVGIAQPKEKPAKVKPPEPVTASSPVKNPAFQGVEAPPLPISGSKQAQLEALLEKYKTDQVTPAEYQVERAKILAEP
jgi:hypothetical protein